MSANVLSVDEDGREDEAAGLDHRHVALGDGVDHVLADAGIDEDVLDHHDADDEIGEVESDDRDDRPGRVRQRVARRRRASAVSPFRKAISI